MFQIIKIIVFISVFTLIRGESGECSWYGAPEENLEGAFTASGERFNSNALTAAHKTLPFGTIVTVSCNGKSVTVRINDRGPFTHGRILDVSRAAASQLGIIHRGLCKCHIETSGSNSVSGPLPGPISGSCRELWNNKCTSNGECCSGFCDKPPHWQYGVCKNR